MFSNLAFRFKCFKGTVSNVIFFYGTNRFLLFRFLTQAEFYVLHQTKCNTLPNMLQAAGGS